MTLQFCFKLFLLAALTCLATIAFADETQAISEKQRSSDIKRSLSALQDIKGNQYRPFESSEFRGAVLIFVLADCPISNSYSQEYNRLNQDYTSRGIEFYLVHPDPHITSEKAARHAAEYELKPPVFLDPKHRIVDAVGATITPESAVINRKGELVYLGRLDDLYPELGKRAQRVTSTELRDAIDAVLDDRPIEHPRVKAVGCNIADLK
jgi:hypothetical protein